MNAIEHFEEIDLTYRGAGKEGFVKTSSINSLEQLLEIARTPLPQDLFGFKAVSYKDPKSGNYTVCFFNGGNEADIYTVHHMDIAVEILQDLGDVPLAVQASKMKEIVTNPEELRDISVDVWMRLLIEKRTIACFERPYGADLMGFQLQYNNRGVLTYTLDSFITKKQVSEFRGDLPRFMDKKTISMAIDEIGKRIIVPDINTSFRENNYYRELSRLVGS